MAELGKRLFFDKRLSGDAALSCASCHIPEKGFADGLPLSKAYPGSEGFRNTPTLINTARKAAWFHDGRIGTNLNDVTREMITESYLMNMDMRLMQERLKQDPVYVEMFEKAGLGEPSNGGARKAIPEYLKTLTSRGAPFDLNEMVPAAGDSSCSRARPAASNATPGPASPTTRPTTSGCRRTRRSGATRCVT
jgi:cytochrome c peroxidase